MSAWQEQMELEWLAEGLGAGDSGDAAELALKALLELNQLWGSASRAVLYSCKYSCFTLVAKFLCYYAVINLAFLPCLSSFLKFCGQ